jgi:Ni,Fe-hydrogenase I small subunit
MKRRDFLKAAGCGAAALALSNPIVTIKAAERKKKPNIVYIMADDLV